MKNNSIIQIFKNKKIVNMSKYNMQNLYKLFLYILSFQSIFYFENEIFY